MREQVEIDLGEMHLSRLDAVIDPVIKEELPLMLWCPHGHDEAIEALRSMTDVMLLDSDQLDEPDAALARAQDLAGTSYVVDLAWLRTTPWRERIASSFDIPERLKRLRDVEQLTIRFREDSMASASLLAGWLASRLGWELGHLGQGSGWQQAKAQRRGGEVQIVMKSTHQDAPGLAGVTVSCAGRFSLSLDRSQGGLRAREVRHGGEKEWRVLGASRGEGGILGEGVRQALLRDPTYQPALTAARSFWN
jgi:glucose-6-phosphate dehydrogenase assembly protein OpcA